MRWIALIIVLGALVGCASGSSIVTGKTRAEIPVECVTNYLQPPPSYETVGLIEAFSTDDSAPMASVLSAAVPALKRRAAKMGANGILLHRVELKAESVSHRTGRLVGGILFGRRFKRVWLVKATAIFDRQWIGPACIFHPTASAGPSDHKRSPSSPLASPGWAS